MNYTEAQLNNMTKAQLVDITAKLGDKVEALSAGPVTADTIKAEYLSLKKEGADIAERRQLAKQAHAEAIEKIKADNEKSIKELELKFALNETTPADEIDKAYEDLEAKALKAVKDLSFGLEKAENDAKVELDKLKDKTDKAQAKFDALVADLTQKEKDSTAKYIQDETNKQVAHTRKMEQQEYDNSIALRDNNNNFIKNVAYKLGISLIETEELKELESFKAKEESEVALIVEEAVKTAKYAVYAETNGKSAAAKAAYESEIALLKNDKSHLEATVKSQESRITDLENRLKDVPAQIAEAVKAAQSSVTVNQDSTKK